MRVMRFYFLPVRGHCQDLSLSDPERKGLRDQDDDRRSAQSCKRGFALILGEESFTRAAARAKSSASSIDSSGGSQTRRAASLSPSPFPPSLALPLPALSPPHPCA